VALAERSLITWAVPAIRSRIILQVSSPAAPTISCLRRIQRS
jgi:hypothetical protein